MTLKTPLMLVTLVVAAASAENLWAIPITVDLGPPDTIHSELAFSLPGISGTLAPGQTISVDVTFANGEFVRVFAEKNNNFDAVYAFSLNELSTAIGSLVESAYFLGADGNAITEPEIHVETLTGFPFGGFGTGVFLTTPLDFYGFHFDLTSNLDRPLVIADARLGFSDPLGKGFLVGPRVPETGSTLLLLGIGAAGLLGLRRITGFA